MKNRKPIRNSLLIIPALLMLLFGACKHDDLEIAKPNENFRLAADFIKNNYDLTLFSAAVEKSGMAETLRGKGPFTLLAPSNTAFNEIGISKASDFDKMNPDSLKALVRCHILNQQLLFSQVPVNGVDIRYRTLAETQVYATLASYAPNNSAYPANNLYFNGSSVTRKDVTIANGIIHVLNKVMKVTPNSTVRDWLAKRPQYSIFVSGLKKFGFWERLSGAGPFTVFAPQNSVFEAQNITEASIAALDPATHSGERLFGSYILHNKHFFISDYNVFYIINNESAYNGQLDNDSWYFIISTERNFFTAAVTYSAHLQTALDYPYDTYPAAGSTTPALTDNLTDNGLVHDMQGLLLLPEQALKH
ncbi:fasciclin domain-containing protein [Mucilaginibacter pocheonensis]|uniref:Surface protein with fasciclin (FAS1) repeats n=1 Tax=Mucilaginibacter pocheonensis TaxID=398050 RepID=A0ABU1TFP3_9SPHI|nr:fasciclin domain-containing protein [Mucilaginibacter pocheonensis]MDR6944223.1 putative surface protein with fasciclin (FAS1) repeats [Mucilaginibacter pocheonensis]